MKNFVFFTLLMLVQQYNILGQSYNNSIDAYLTFDQDSVVVVNDSIPDNLISYQVIIQNDSNPLQSEVYHSYDEVGIYSTEGWCNIRIQKIAIVWQDSGLIGISSNVVKIYNDPSPPHVEVSLDKYMKKVTLDISGGDNWDHAVITFINFLPRIVQARRDVPYAMYEQHHIIQGNGEHSFRLKLPNFRTHQPYWCTIVFEYGGCYTTRSILFYY